MTNRSTNCE